MRSGIPLAWLQLKKKKIRMMVGAAGIGFAAVLMIVQMGFQAALFQSVGHLFESLDADILVVSPQYQFATSSSPFTERRLFQAAGVRGVENVSSIYLGLAPWRNPVTWRPRNIFIIGMKPERGVFDIAGLDAQVDALKVPDRVLFDIGSRPEFGPVATLSGEHGPLETELGGKRVAVVGLFKLGASFTADGNVLASEDTFLHLLPFRSRGLVDVGLIRIARGTEANEVRDRLREALPRDVLVYTRAEFIEREQRFWAQTTPIGFIFKLVVVLSILVGGASVYQILYNEIVENLGEYATLKAMGFSDSYLQGVVVKQAAILSLIGFVPGVLFSQLVYAIARRETMLPFSMTMGRLAVVYALMAALCVISGYLAARKLKVADPAEIF